MEYNNFLKEEVKVTNGGGKYNQAPGHKRGSAVDTSDGEDESIIED